MENENDYSSLVAPYRRVDYGRVDYGDGQYYIYDTATRRITEENGIVCNPTEVSKVSVIGKNPDCVLDDVLLNLKKGLKPYYQERLDHYTDNKGCYIEYEPGMELLPSQKVEWLVSKTVEKINALYESKKKAYHDKINAEKIYHDKIASLEKSIENYKTKGHDLMI
jgi:hypothetical protein